MFKKIIKYIFSNPLTKISKDMEEYDVVKQKYTDIEYKLSDARRVLIRPYVSNAKEITSCIRREINFPSINMDLQNNQPVVIEHFCSNFNENSLMYGDTCFCETCPSYQKYKKYAELLRRHAELANEKKVFWKNALLAHQK